MKMKFFTLIIAILCLSMLFVACNDGKVVCDGHTDANADKLCDTCSYDLSVPDHVCTPNVNTWKYTNEVHYRECSCGKTWRGCF